MTNVTDKVRAALEDAMHNARDGHSYDAYLTIRDTLRELDGKVLVPVEPTVAMGLAWNKAAMDRASYFSTAYYKAMIAPYVEGETE